MDAINLNEMSKLEIIDMFLRKTPEIVILDVKEHFPLRSGWSQTVDFVIAAKRSRYDPEELQQFMLGLLPEIEHTQKDDFSIRHDELSFGKLCFDEDLNDDEVKSFLEQGIIREKPNGDYQRRTWVRLFPDQHIAKASLEDRLGSPTYSIYLKDIEKYQPGYKPGIFERVREKGKGVLAKTRNIVSPHMTQLFENERLHEWRKTQYERHLLLTLVSTYKCSLKCDHCFEEAGPERNEYLDKDMVEDIAEEAVKLFEKYPGSEIRITGGDPFLNPHLFDIIGSFTKRKERMNFSTLDVETNGWWAVDEDRTLDNVLMLLESGATLLSMTIDYWHSKGGIFDVDEHFNRIEKICEEQGLEFRYITTSMPVLNSETGDSIPEVTPIGRARNLPEKYWGSHYTCKATGCRLTPPIFAQVEGDYTHTDEITISADGNVYSCFTGKQFEHAGLSLGNIHHKPLLDIVENGGNQVVELIREKGLRALSKKAGMSLREHWDMYEKFSPCGMCHELLRAYGKEISDNLRK